MSSSVQMWLTHRQKADQQGVSTRTLDRWIEAGVLEPPRIVRGRKFHAVDAQPRPDQRPSENAA